MRVLLTGATGFIGKKLGLELARKGHELFCLVRDPRKTELPYPAQLLAWKNPGELRDIDAVIHLAGESIAGGRWTRDRKEKILRSRVDTAHQVIEMVRNAKGRRPSVFLSASGMGYYGDRGDIFLSENSGAGEDFLAEVCLAWEGAAESARSFIPRVAYLRTAMVLGRDGGALPVMLPAFKAGLGGRLGSGRQWMSWIHVEDLVQLYLFALTDARVDGALNAAAPSPVTNAEFTRALAKALGRSAFFAVPATVLKIALGEMSALLLASQRSRTRAPDLGFRFRFEKIGDAFGAVFKHVERARGALCHEFVAQSWVSCPVEKTFAVFADPKNLERLAPAHLGAKVDGQNALRLRENALFTYELRGHRPRWKFRFHVIDWIENTRYSCLAQATPFTLWFHVHQFERIQGGTLVTERILYRCRGGLFGSLLGRPRVEKMLREIFRGRGRKVAALAESGAGVPPLESELGVTA